MRWSGAMCALFLCLLVCLLVVAIRVRTLELRALTHAAHRHALDAEAERDRLVAIIASLERTDALRGSSPVGRD